MINHRQVLAGLLLLTWFLLSPLEHLALILLFCFMGWFIYPNQIKSIGLLTCLALILFGHIGIFQSFGILFSHPVRLLVVGCLMSEVIVKNDIHLIISQKIMQTFQPKTEFRLSWVLFLSAGFLSMWVSNTSAVAMLIPVVMFLSSDLELLPEPLLLAIAYGATIGGMLTPIGAPSNLIAIGYAERYFNISLDFATWFMWTSPFVLMLSLCMLVYFYVVSEKKVFSTEIETMKVGDVQAEIMMGLLVCVVLWATQSLWSKLLGFRIAEEWIGGVFLYFCSHRIYKHRYSFELYDLTKIPFSSIILVVTGIFMADALMGHNFIDLLLSSIQEGQIWEDYQVMTIFGLGISVMTELCSNTAVTSLTLPLSSIITKLAHLEVVPAVLLITLSANSAFMLPTATPPNALVLGTGKLSSRRLMLVGGLLSMCSLVILITLFIR